MADKTKKMGSARDLVAAGKLSIECGGPDGVPVGAGWTRTTRPSLLARAYACARGSYQRALLGGEEALSGSTLIGRAKDWLSGYRRSRENLFARLDAAGVENLEIKHGRKRVLLIGPHADCVQLWC